MLPEMLPLGGSPGFLKLILLDKKRVTFKGVHIVVPFAYLLLSYSKLEWAENTGSHKKVEQ